MADPIMMAIATALAEKAADAVAAGVRNSWSALVRLVRERLAVDAESVQALAVVESGVHGGTEASALARRLGELAATDPGFGAELRRLWTEVDAGVSADRGGVVNQVSGTVHGPVVQAGKIHGGVHFGGFAPPEP